MLNFGRIKNKLNNISHSTLKNSKDIVQVGNTSIIYNTYRIIKKDEWFDVYKDINYIGRMNYKASAVAWCIANKNNRIMLANDIRRCDTRLTYKQFDIENIRYGLKQKDINQEQKNTMCDRLKEDNILYNKLKTDLSNCVNKAKYIKTKGLSK